jgi:hypothetical protein
MESEDSVDICDGHAPGEAHNHDRIDVMAQMSATLRLWLTQDFDAATKLSPFVDKVVPGR